MNKTVFKIRFRNLLLNPKTITIGLAAAIIYTLINITGFELSYAKGLISLQTTVLTRSEIPAPQIPTPAENSLPSANPSGILQSPDSADQTSSENWQVVKMRVTAYCPCAKCCGKWADGTTACGHKIESGETFVAADKNYSFGTELIIPGYNNDNPVKVLDRGKAIVGDKIDVFFPTHQEARNWGVKYLDVKVKS